MGSVPRSIDTAYSNCLFRSRLEARWAVFFDQMKFKWEYEREGYELPSGRYLPDFWLPKVRMWAEVKPEPFSPIELRKAQELAAVTQHPVILLDGPPALRTYWSVYAPSLDWESGFSDLIWDEGSRYYHDESRFYSNTGETTFPKPYSCPDFLSEEVHDAVDAALSARFEFGESGGIKQAFKRVILNG